MRYSNVTKKRDCVLQLEKLNLKLDFWKMDFEHIKSTWALGNLNYKDGVFILFFPYHQWETQSFRNTNLDLHHFGLRLYLHASLVSSQMGLNVLWDWKLSSFKCSLKFPSWFLKIRVEWRKIVDGFIVEEGERFNGPSTRA